MYVNSARTEYSVDEVKVIEQFGGCLPVLAYAARDERKTLGDQWIQGTLKAKSN